MNSVLLGCFLISVLMRSCHSMERSRSNNQVISQGDEIFWIFFFTTFEEWKGKLLQGLTHKFSPLFGVKAAKHFATKFIILSLNSEYQKVGPMIFPQ